MTDREDWREQAHFWEGRAKEALARIERQAAEIASKDALVNSKQRNLDILHENHRNAQAEIERQAAEIERLREALEWIERAAINAKHNFIADKAHSALSTAGDETAPMGERLISAAKEAAAIARGMEPVAVHCPQSDAGEIVEHLRDCADALASEGYAFSPGVMQDAASLIERQAKEVRALNASLDKARSALE